MVKLKLFSTGRPPGSGGDFTISHKEWFFPPENIALDPYLWARRRSGLWPLQPLDPIEVMYELYVADPPSPLNSRGPCPAMTSSQNPTQTFLV